MMVMELCLSFNRLSENCLEGLRVNSILFSPLPHHPSPPIEGEQEGADPENHKLPIKHPKKNAKKQEPTKIRPVKQN